MQSSFSTGFGAHLWGRALRHGWKVRTQDSFQSPVAGEATVSFESGLHHCHALGTAFLIDWPCIKLIAPVYQKLDQAYMHTRLCRSTPDYLSDQQLCLLAFVMYHHGHAPTKTCMSQSEKVLASVTWLRWGNTISSPWQPVNMLHICFTSHQESGGKGAYSDDAFALLEVLIIHLPKDYSLIKSQLPSLIRFAMPRDLQLA